VALSGIRHSNYLKDGAATADGIEDLASYRETSHVSHRPHGRQGFGGGSNVSVGRWEALRY
jgi:hypothetical protein